MKQFKQIRRAGVPLCGVETADPAASILACIKTLGKKEEQDAIPLMEWSIIRGLTPLNTAGADAMSAVELSPENTLNPAECLGFLANKASARNSPLADAVIFMHQANRLVDEFGPCQGIWHCRDPFKAAHITLVLLAPALILPAELRNDVVILAEPLPDAEELEVIAKSVIGDAGLDLEKVDGGLPKAVDTLRGLSAFAAEQCLALSLSKTGIDLRELMKLKRSYISQTPGIEVREDKVTFADIAGYENVKNLLRRKIEGKRPPSLVIWWDEFDRTIAANSSDTSGTTQDQMAVLLQFLQDRLNEDRLSAMILVGTPGSGKSLIASSLRNEAKCECLRWDMGGMKDSLVGSSEKRIRNVLKVTDAMSGGHILVVATANSLNGVPSPVINRFALGTYYFPLPTEEEGAAIWKLKRKKYEIPTDQKNPTAAPLTGREINQCCFIADDLKMPLADAIKYITPYYITNQAEVESLNNQAHNRWLSASVPGFYRKPSSESAMTGRKLQID